MVGHDGSTTEKECFKYHQISQISPPLQFIWNGIRCIYLLLLLFVIEKPWYDPVEHRLLLGHGTLLSARERLHRKFRLSTQRSMEFLPLLAGLPNLRLYYGWVWQTCGRPVMGWERPCWRAGRHCLTLQNTAVRSQEEAADITCTGTAQCMKCHNSHNAEQNFLHAPLVAATTGSHSAPRAPKAIAAIFPSLTSWSPVTFLPSGWSLPLPRTPHAFLTSLTLTVTQR